MNARVLALVVLLVAALPSAATATKAKALRPSASTSVPRDQRGQIDAERVGVHDAANIRTRFWNFGMVGDFYSQDPVNVDLSVFHSAEVPRGSGMNYSDGITPFVLARIDGEDGRVFHIMETGFRERQALLGPPFPELAQMRMEPRPGYFEKDPIRNRARSPAISNDPRTWPASWPDKLNDPDDPGWSGSWNGYFGKRPAADQESFTVMDDDYYGYGPWVYHADSTDPTRGGLGLRIEVRGFQWANPQAGNVIFWHYDITNESTTDYNDNIVFGLYMDSGVGGSAISCDGVAESDDDNAFFDRSLGLNLVYTWDKNGHGRDLSGNCGRTGYLGYAYLETPGNAFDDDDNDLDGVTDELRDGGPGDLITGQDAILAYLGAHYDTTRFVQFYGPIATRPAYRIGSWWTGDEDMDWIQELHDVGADGVRETGDLGENDGMPTVGEPSFDRTDLNESDQIGLTGFKMSRIICGGVVGDDILFYRTSSTDWPQTLYERFTNSDPNVRFDAPLAENCNIAFLFASGPFQLKAGKTERFSLALAYGADLTELRTNVRTVQQIYNANYQFAVPPPLPTLTAETGDGVVRLSWDNVAERAIDPVSGDTDFEGYRIYRSTDPNFLDPQVVTTPRGNPFPSNGKPIAQFDLVDGRTGYSRKQVEGVAYWLGEDTGLRHTFEDRTVTNGQEYFYAVCAYDYGSLEDVPDTVAYYPSENAIAVSRTPRGGLIVPRNVVVVRPNPRIPTWLEAMADATTHVAGRGVGTVGIRVVNSNLVPDGHTFKITFTTPAPESLRARTYTLTDSTTGDVLFIGGAEFGGQATGPVGAGVQPIIRTAAQVTIDSARTGFLPGSRTNTKLKTSYQPGRDVNYRRTGFPDDIRIVFSDTFVDTGIVFPPARVRAPAKFKVWAYPATGDSIQLDFRFKDVNLDGTLTLVDLDPSRSPDSTEAIEIVTFTNPPPSAFDITWRVELDTVGQGLRGPIAPQGAGDVYHLKLIRPFSDDDVFVFSTRGQRLDGAAAGAVAPYVVPNPYVGAASFEPERFAISGRGERRIEFRAIPIHAVIRIYTTHGELVQTLRQDGSQSGFVAWDLRSKDNLDVAPGLYVFHMEAPGVQEHVGKFAIIK